MQRNLLVLVLVSTCHAYGPGDNLADYGPYGSVPDWSIIELEGWTMELPNKTVAAFKWARSPTGKACLDLCITEKGCRFVSYNLDTKECSGHKVSVEGILRPNASNSLVAMSKKGLWMMPGTAINAEQADFILNADRTKDVANAARIYNGQVCSNLCTIHPRCIAASFYHKKPSFGSSSGSLIGAECHLISNFKTDGYFLTDNDSFSAYVTV